MLHLIEQLHDINENVIKIDKAVEEINKSNDKLNKQIHSKGYSIDVDEINNLLQKCKNYN